MAERRSLPRCAGGNSADVRQPSEARPLALCTVHPHCQLPGRSVATAALPARVQPGCRGVPQLGECRKRALHHVGDVRDLTGEAVTGVGEPALAGIDRGEAGVREPPGERAPASLRPLASIAPATEANSASSASLVGDAQTEL